MEKLFKKIQKYKDSIDGPFFCILSDAHATASLAKNVSAGVILKAASTQYGKPGKIKTLRPPHTWNS